MKRIALVSALTTTLALAGTASAGFSTPPSTYKLNVGIPGDQDPITALAEDDNDYLNLGSEGIGGGKRRVVFTTTHIGPADDNDALLWRLDGKTSPKEPCDFVIKAYHWKRKRFVRANPEGDQVTDIEGAHSGGVVDGSPYVNGTNKVKLQWSCTRAGAFSLDVDSVSVNE
jgi:hypothetical protein